MTVDTDHAVTESDGSGSAVTETDGSEVEAPVEASEPVGGHPP